MFRRSFLLLLALSLSPLALAENSQVLLRTSAGEITLELYPGSAPKTVENFLQYVDDGFYDGTIFHRVINNFMIQGGGFLPDMDKKPARAPVVNESIGGLSNARGTIAMARTNNPHSATSQFFINTVDNLRLDGVDRRPGYTVFGKVVSGMDVVDKIGKVATGNHGPYRDVPLQPVVIEKAERVK
ncbi:peptidylprolyl isomerase [Marinobacterium arenosum]|uniref:peptidylprolyl isomerase n=1 Tax=Marinobacterium arenosum TaxID=2862496 RepID=UPI001C93F6B5|nr:peptidylprolyl isomerase [Marinobacterium arenosum]MBY4675445.1 peptidyl-prolyl cis-trans isomerase [Marinobacterium arenosum]